MAAEREPPVMGDDLFGLPPEPSQGRNADTRKKPAPTQPLADRLRPQRLEDVVGQAHLLGPEGALTRMLERGSLASLILWGGPGVGRRETRLAI